MYAQIMRAKCVKVEVLLLCGSAFWLHFNNRIILYSSQFNVTEHQSPDSDVVPPLLVESRKS